MACHFVRGIGYVCVKVRFFGKYCNVFSRESMKLTAYVKLFEACSIRVYIPTRLTTIQKVSGIMGQKKRSAWAASRSPPGTHQVALLRESLEGQQAGVPQRPQHHHHLPLPVSRLAVAAGVADLLLDVGEEGPAMARGSVRKERE